MRVFPRKTKEDADDIIFLRKWQEILKIPSWFNITNKWVNVEQSSSETLASFAWTPPFAIWHRQPNKAKASLPSLSRKPSTSPAWNRPSHRRRVGLQLPHLVQRSPRPPRRLWDQRHWDALREPSFQFVAAGCYRVLFIYLHVDYYIQIWIWYEFICSERYIWIFTYGFNLVCK